MSGLARYGRETRAHRESVERVRDRIEPRVWEIQVAARPRRPLHLALAAAAAVAVLSLAVRSARAPSSPLPPPRLAVSLQAADGADPAAALLGDSIGLRFQGTGRVYGTPSRPVVRWTRGLLAVEVEPGKDVALEVSTEEAAVRVLGTVFEVERDALGTSVRVTRGRVSVTCLGAAELVLGAGQESLCLPTTAAGLLGRARRLQDRAAPTAAVLSATAAGLAAGPSPAISVELETTAIEALIAADRHAEALAATRRLLDRGAGHRQPALLRLESALSGPPSPQVPLGADDPRRPALLGEPR